MIRIARGRRTGRTTEIIKICAEHGGYIVCRHAMVNAIAKQAKEMELNIPQPLSYQEFASRSYHARGVSKVYIDDADAFLQHMFGDVEIKAISILDKKTISKNET